MKLIFKNPYTLEIPEGVENITFQDLLCECSNNDIRKVILPSTLKRIRQSTFTQFYNLEEINFPDSLERIEQGAFASCISLTNIKLNEGLEYIGEDAFYGCAIETLHIPSTVNQISGSIASNNSYSLKSITVSKDNERYSDMNCNVIYDKNTKTVIQGCKESTIPEEANTIGIRAFFNVGIQKITLPKNLQEVSDIAFIDNENLTEIYVECPINAIVSTAFDECINLNEIYVKDIDKKSAFYRAYKNIIKPFSIEELIKEGRSINEINRFYKETNEAKNDEFLWI